MTLSVALGMSLQLQEAMLHRLYGDLDRIILPGCAHSKHISWLDSESRFNGCPSINVSMTAYHSLMTQGKLPTCKGKFSATDIVADSSAVEAFNLNCRKHNAVWSKIEDKLPHLFEFLKAHDLRFTLSHGSLLAHYRFGTLMQPWDDDIDLMAPASTWRFISRNATNPGFTRMKSDTPTFILSPVITHDEMPACLLFETHGRPGLVQVWWRRNCHTHWKLKLADIFIVDCAKCTPTPEQRVWLES